MRLSTTSKTKDSQGIAVGCAVKDCCFSKESVKECVDAALEDLKRKAKKLGVNEVVGVQVIQSFQGDTLYVTAIGTAICRKQLTIPDSL